METTAARISKHWKAACLLTALIVAPLAAGAHNPDTSYARIIVGDNAVETRLTYDLFTLQKILPVDADSDQRVSRDELKIATPGLEKFLRERVIFEINTNLTTLGALTAARWPTNAGEFVAARDWHTRDALVQFTFSRPVAEMPLDVCIAFDFFEQFGLRHTVLGSFEQDGRSTEVTFTRDEPDFLYDTGFVPSLASRLVKFLLLGVEHIFLGYDHVCFLVALIVVSRFKELVKIVTSFTVAHTITLILAALEVVTLPMRLIESGIALTIIYVAAQNFWLKPDAHRWKLTFTFGLIHGFGFANVLRELGLPTSGTIRCLLTFNLGVELGQIAIVAALLPVSFALTTWRHGQRARMAVSLAILVLGISWLAERTLDIRFMPF